MYIQVHLHSAYHPLSPYTFICLTLTIEFTQFVTFNFVRIIRA